jgi:formylmethanofuran dehydrogenase subunit E
MGVPASCGRWNWRSGHIESLQLTRPWRRSPTSLQSTDMTKAEADGIQLRWTKQENPPLCEHRKVELEQTEGGEVSGTYRCTTCDEVVPG